MSDAINNPVGRPRKELHSDDVKMQQRKPVNLDLPREKEEIELLDGAVGPQDAEAYYAELKFNEEPMTIQINRQSGKHSPTTVICSVGSKGAEQLRNGKWMICGWLPVGVPVTTRRKYVEVLARSKRDSIETRVVKHETSEDNMVIPSTGSENSFSVLLDNNPRGFEWLSRVLMEQ